MNNCFVCGKEDVTTELCNECLLGGIQMDFSQALSSLKKGYKVQRSGWNGKGMYVFLNTNIEDIEPFFVIRTVNKTYNTWVPSISDLLSNDWESVE
jgi:hypothetical protein